jgi:hypothetical protein
MLCRIPPIACRARADPRRNPATLVLRPWFALPTCYLLPVTRHEHKEGKDKRRQDAEGGRLMFLKKAVLLLPQKQIVRYRGEQVAAEIRTIRTVNDSAS